ncbi:hypothetical protein, partial [Pseudomonas sp. RTB2]
IDALQPMAAVAALFLCGFNLKLDKLLARARPTTRYLRYAFDRQTHWPVHIGSVQRAGSFTPAHNPDFNVADYKATDEVYRLL